MKSSPQYTHYTVTIIYYAVRTWIGSNKNRPQKKSTTVT